MYENEICSICVAENGFIAKLRNVSGEEKAKQKNMKSSGYVPTPGPDVLIAPTMGGLLKILKERLPDIAEEYNEYSGAFDEAVASAPKSKY